MRGYEDREYQSGSASEVAVLLPQFAQYVPHAAVRSMHSPTYGSRAISCRHESCSTRPTCAAVLLNITTAMLNILFFLILCAILLQLQQIAALMAGAAAREYKSIPLGFSEMNDHSIIVTSTRFKEAHSVQHEAPSPSAFSNVAVISSMEGRVQNESRCDPGHGSSQLSADNNTEAHAQAARSANASSATRPVILDWGDPLAPFEGLARLNNASARFFTVWYNQTAGTLAVQVSADAVEAPASSSSSLFVVGATVSRGDGVHALAHEAVTEAVAFRFAPTPSKRDVDLVRPQLRMRGRGGGVPGDVPGESVFADGVWSGWLRTLPATKLVEWTRRARDASATTADGRSGGEGAEGNEVSRRVRHGSKTAATSPKAKRAVAHVLSRKSRFAKERQGLEQAGSKVAPMLMADSDSEDSDSFKEEAMQVPSRRLDSLSLRSKAGASRSQPRRKRAPGKSGSAAQGKSGSAAQGKSGSAAQTAGAQPPSGPRLGRDAPPVAADAADADATATTAAATERPAIAVAANASAAANSSESAAAATRARNQTRVHAASGSHAARTQAQQRRRATLPACLAGPARLWRQADEPSPAPRLPVRGSSRGQKLPHQDGGTGADGDERDGSGDERDGDGDGGHGEGDGGGSGSGANPALPCVPDTYEQAGAWYLIDLSSWLRQGASVLNPSTKLSESRLSWASAFPLNAEIRVQAHVASGRVGVEDANGDGARKASLELQVSLSALPPLDGSFVGRAADDRVGYWVLHYTSLGAHQPRAPLGEESLDKQVRIIHRWRLEPSFPPDHAVATRPAASTTVAGETTPSSSASTTAATSSSAAATAATSFAASGAAPRAEPSRVLLPPRRAVTFHLDPSVPPRWREAVARGVLAWTRAFEDAGFSRALRVLAPTDADFPRDYSAGDVRYSSISWAVSRQETFAAATHTADPRTGEILNAKIIFTQSFLKHWLEQPELRDQFGAAGIGGSAGAGALATGRTVGFDDGDDGTVGYSEGAKSAAASWRRLRAGGRSSAAASAVRLQWRLDDALSDAMSEARVAGVPDRLRPRPGPCGFRHADETHALLALIRSDADASGSGSDDQASARLVEAAITDVIMHEVGHALGLRHNFRASAAYSMEQIQDRHFTANHGISASVMDYVPPSVPSNRSKQGDYFSTVVGEYDRHAIEYGYVPIEGEAHGVQHPRLAEIARRGESRPELAFGSDEDVPSSAGADPLTSVYDLSSDPIAFYADRLLLAHNLLRDAAQRTVRPGEPWTRQRSAIDSTIRIALRAGVYCTKYIGGYIYSKAHKGRSANGSRSFDPESTRGSAQRHTMRTDAPITPVSGTEQARALRLSLLLLSHRFWLPVASASRQLPKRTGDCGAVDEHCLGVEATDLWAIMTRARRLVLASLLRPRRLAGLRDHEWQACEASTPHRGASAASGEREGELAIEDTSADSANPSTLWAARLSTPIAQMLRAASIDASAGTRDDAAIIPNAASGGTGPASPSAAPRAHASASDALSPLDEAGWTLSAAGDAAVEAFGRSPSVESLLRAVDAALALPSAPALLAEPIAHAKMRYEMQRVWLSTLAALSSGSIDESAAVATLLLHQARADVASAPAALSKTAAQETSAAPSHAGRRQDFTPGDAGFPKESAFQAHMASVSRILSLWERGLFVSDGWPDGVDS